MPDNEIRFDPDELSRRVGAMLFRISQIADSAAEQAAIQDLDNQFSAALERLTDILRTIQNLNGLTREGIRNALGKIRADGFCGMY